MNELGASSTTEESKTHVLLQARHLLAEVDRRTLLHRREESKGQLSFRGAKQAGRRLAR